MEINASLAAPRHDAKVIGLICTGHFFSHFYMLLLPPLLPVLREVYGVGYTELGLALTTFSIATGLTQVPIGFLVDRYGARTILIVGIMVESLAIASIGVFPFYNALLALIALAGFANAVYHPADYAILNSSINNQRMGRAFSIHTFAGYLGEAIAPATMLFLMTLTDWRSGLIICGLSGAVIAVIMGLNSSVLQDAHLSKHPNGKPTAKAGRTGLQLLFSIPILMGLLFFVGIALAGRGISGFSVATLNTLYATPLSEAGAVLSAYLFASPLGVLLGGWIADRIDRHDIIVALCFVGVASAFFTVAATELPLAGIAILFAFAGLCAGIVAPSRDMMIRSVTPSGETGKVFGFVSTGFNIGGIIGPALFGYLLDNAHPKLLFWAIGVISLLTVATVLETGRRAGQAIK